MRLVSYTVGVKLANVFARVLEEFLVRGKGGEVDCVTYLVLTCLDFEYYM